MDKNIKKLDKAINELAISHKGVESDYKEEWDATRYMVGSKMFMMRGEDNAGRQLLTFKLKPENGELLRASYPNHIVPGYYMNKVHWNSLYLDLPLPVEQEQLAGWIKEAYELVSASLTQKLQRELGIKD